MPARSKAQLGKLFVLQRQGKLKPGTAEEFARETPDVSNLPEHVKGSKFVKLGKRFARKGRK